VPIFLVYAEAPSPLSIFYAGIVILPQTAEASLKELQMLSLTTLQAVAQSQIKQRSAVTGSAVTSKAKSKSPRKPLLRRFFDALFEARMRRAEIEIEHHCRFYNGHLK